MSHAGSRVAKFGFHLRPVRRAGRIKIGVGEERFQPNDFVFRGQNRVFHSFQFAFLFPF